MKESIILQIEIIHARDHMPDHYAPYLDGYRAVRLIDEAGTIRGELVWCLATGHTIEITEMGLFQGEDRGRGLGTQLLTAAIEDMRSFLHKIGSEMTRIYLYCEAKNKEARGFYEARGFNCEAVLQHFYDDGDAMFYVRPFES